MGERRWIPGERMKGETMNGLRRDTKRRGIRKTTAVALTLFTIAATLIAPTVMTAASSGDMGGGILI